MNIKEIGKELMGKSLNSYHRKLGLTQLEENNKMQDGILNGILSQVDDAYIEKTEQSNVIHLDGSGDGVVVLDSIEGNTMVNIFNNVTGAVSLDNVVSSYANNTLTYKAQSGFEGNIYPAFLGNLVTNYNLSTNKKYTFVFECNIQGAEFGLQGVKSDGRWVAGMTIKTIAKIGVNIIEFTTPNDLSEMNALKFRLYNSTTNNEHKFSNFQIYEGDISTLPNGYFKGIKSSFEEKVNDEGKYEIEILSRNTNIIGTNYTITQGYFNNGVPVNWMEYWRGNDYIPCSPSTTYYAKYKYNGESRVAELFFFDKNKNYIGKKSNGGASPTNAYYCIIGAFSTTGTGVQIDLKKVTDIIVSTKNIEYIEPKQNKIKLLLDEPLRSGVTKKDNLCVIDNKLYIERNTKQLIFDGSRNWIISNGHENICHARLPQSVIGKDIDLTAQNSKIKGYCDKLSSREHGIWNQDIEGIHTNNSPNFDNRALFINIKRATLGGNTSEILKTYLSNNPIKLVIETYEPVYEEVVNEYGEPIILEGYENGTLYIDSTIVPTTTVRYTPKMESFKTLKEVKNNNIMLTNDVNDNIIPYMMDVDLMIMEKEMALMSHKNIRKMEVLDMTSMQKRTQDMLERLIKGKTLTEQECKTRVTTYLNAGKITDSQAEELMLLIDEVYA